MSKSKTGPAAVADSSVVPATLPDEAGAVLTADAAPSEIIVTPPAPPPATDLVSEAEPQNATPWLTTAPSAAFGPAGHILNLTPSEAAVAPDGLLIAPTPEQLAQRL